MDQADLVLKCRRFCKAMIDPEVGEREIQVMVVEMVLLSYDKNLTKENRFALSNAFTFWQLSLKGAFLE